MSIVNAHLVPGFDFTDPAVLEHGVPAQEFALLRRTSPVWWNSQPTGTSGFHDGGFWVISKHADVKQISRDSASWSANINGVVMRHPDWMTADQIDLTKALLINHDAPTHTRLRKLVSRLFIPRAVNALEDRLCTAARTIVRTAADKGAGNFVDDIAAQLPLLAIADLLGVPEGDRDKLFAWSNAMTNTDDPESGGDPITANAEMLSYAYQLAEQRRQRPAGDIITTLVQADIDGEALDEAEFGFFVILLAVAGNETTRNTITHGMNAFFDHPDQWDLYKQHRPATTADEIIRWATPVHCFQRTALCDTEISGITIRAGQRAGMFYSSANFDEDVFDHPFNFNILRSPNPHLAFGGNGAHYCIGASLARMQIKIMFDAIADIVPHLHRVNQPRRLRSGWINGIKELSVRYDSKSPSQQRGLKQVKLGGHTPTPRH
jgi:cholest-4-en-3-one 26-monooxygenase